MDSVNNTVTQSASNASAGSVQQAAAISVLKSALNSQASAAAQLIAALPQPALATQGSVGTQVNTYA